jgi:hypothetical protein
MTVRSEVPAPLAPAVPREQIAHLETVAGWCESLARSPLGRFERAFCLAAAMRRLRGLVTDQMMADVMALQGSPLGFRTDRDEAGGYPLSVVKEVVIEATLRGLRLVGNEVNIIAGRCYVTKEGLLRLVRNWPGLANLRLDLRAPKIEGDWALVPCRATWTLYGEPRVLDCTAERSIPVRVNKGMIVDAILGKAQRKLLARIYEQLCGDAAHLADEDETPAGADPSAGSGAPCPEVAAPSSPLEEYLRQIHGATDRRQIGQTVKMAAVDPQLSAEDRAQVVQAANRRSGELRTGKPEQQNLIDTQASAPEAGW